MKKFCLLSAVLLLPLMSGVAWGGGTIEDGKKVKIDYTLTVDGEIVDSSKDRQPLEYTQGGGDILPALEKELQGLKEGDQKTIKLSAKEGYGEIDPAGLREFPKESFPKEMKIEKGLVLNVQDEQGRGFPATIYDVKDKTVVLSFNHPLAGKDLTFDVTVVQIQ